MVITFSESGPPTRSTKSPVSESQTPTVTRRFRIVTRPWCKTSAILASWPTWSIPKRRTVPVSPVRTFCCGGARASAVSAPPPSVTPPTVTVQTSRGNLVCRRLVIVGTELSIIDALMTIATAMPLAPPWSSSGGGASGREKGAMCVRKALTRRSGLAGSQAPSARALPGTGLGMEVPAASSMFAPTRPMTSAMPHQMSLPEDAKVWPESVISAHLRCS
mmetsp:Transcript_37157/g.107043  ORF Transcript_37157/g.107043 Transcript_37157/m.107043 type:complete len:219 (+) Transcript_37157:190-846(+)